MKKTINTNIAGVIFNVEEDAFAKLDNYLGSVKNHFASNPDSDEIVADIENRIAEQFLQASGPSKIVNIAEVEQLMRIMGEPADFEKESESAPKTAVRPVRKRLFRDQENGIVGGVCAGLAAYFGIEPNIIRLLFVIVVLVGGSGILVYLLLWIAVPEAKTPDEKLEMRGEPLSMDHLREKIRSYQDKAAHQSKSLGQTSNRILNKFLKAIGAVIRAFFAAIGGILMGAAIISFAAVSVAFGVLVINPHSPYVDPSFVRLIEISHPVYYAALILAYLIVTLLLVLLFAISGMFMGKTLISSKAGAMLFGLYVLALIAAGVLAANYAPAYIEQVRNLPQYQDRTVNLPLADFNKVEIDGTANVHFTQGKNFAVTVSGKQLDIDSSDIRVSQNTLVLGRKKTKFCLICLDFNDNLEFTVAAPDLTAVSVFGSGNFKADSITTNDLALSIAGSGNIDLVSKAKSVEAQINGSGNIFNSGSGDSLRLQIVGSGFYKGFEFLTRTADVTVMGSGMAEVAPQNTLSVQIAGSGHVVYANDPKVTQKINGSGSVVPQAR